MARLTSWLSYHVMHALGWALIHSLWQCLGLAALAAVAMAFSRRPSLRYLVATGALVAMLVAPVATFLLLLKPVPDQALISATSGSPLWAASTTVTAAMPATAAVAPMNSETIARENSPKQLLPAHFLPSDFLPPNILPWLVGAWLLGVAFFSLRLAGGLLLLEYKRPPPSCMPDPRILALAHELQRRLGLNRAIQYLECGWLQAPAVIGWVRPVILLPVSAATGLNEMQLRAVIAHELAHIRRFDSLVNLVQVLAETLLFYHPAIWWLNRRIRAERELCCDEIAVSLTGDRLEYAKALTLMAQWQRAPALAMASNRGPLAERIVHILGKKPFGRGQRMLGLAGGIVFLAAAMGGANALFAITHPIPQAPVKASLMPALPRGRIAADQPALEILPATEPPKGAAPDQGGSASAQTPLPHPVQAAAKAHAEASAARSRAEKPLLPLADLSGLLPRETRLTPQAVAWNDPPAAPPAAAARMTARPKGPKLTCAQSSIVASADLEDVSGSDLRTVPVAIDGQPRQFLLDIGTNPTAVSSATARDLGLPGADGPGESMFGNSLQRVAFFNVKGGAEDYRHHVRIDSLTIGGATGHNLTLVVAKDPGMGRSKAYDGLMTGDLFRPYDVELDFAQNKLNFLTPTTCTDPDQVAYWPHAAVAVIPIANLDGKIQVQVEIQGHSIPAVIDTSSPHTVMRRDIAELMLGLKADTPDMAPDGDLTDGTGQQVYRHTFSRISFAGGVTAYNVPGLIQTNSMIHDLNRTPILGMRATFAADPRQRIPGLTLGMDVLNQLHLYLLPAQQKIYVTSAG